MDGWRRMGLDDTFLIKQAFPFGARFSIEEFVNYIIYIYPREGLALPWGLWIGTWEIIREETSSNCCRWHGVLVVLFCVIGVVGLSGCRAFSPLPLVLSSLLLFVVSLILRVVSPPFLLLIVISALLLIPLLLFLSFASFPLIVVISPTLALFPPCWRHFPHVVIVSLSSSCPPRHHFSSSSDSLPFRRHSSSSSSSTFFFINPPPCHQPSCSCSLLTLPLGSTRRRQALAVAGFGGFASPQCTVVIVVIALIAAVIIIVCSLALHLRVVRSSWQRRCGRWMLCGVGIVRDGLGVGGESERKTGYDKCHSPLS